MEPHSVPQDILNAEFKLFGAFSLNQFIKIVIGCLIGLFFFIVIPAQFILIKLPLAIGPVIVGIGVALVPRFAVRFENFVKAIFISPRYIWVKQDRQLDLLSSRTSTAKKKKAAQSARSGTAGHDIDLENVSLDKLLAAREKTPELRKRTAATARDSFDEQPREQNLDRVYDNMYEQEKRKVVQQKAQRQNNIQQDVQRQYIRNQAEQNRKEDASVRFNSPKEIQDKIAELKRKLSQIVKDQNYKAKETEILGEINDMYHELKMMGIETVNPKLQKQQAKAQQTVDPNAKITNFQGVAPDRVGQIIYGIVVDQKDKPVANAEIFFDLKDSSKDTYVSTDSQGKFNSNVSIPPGTYDIQITHPEHKFHTYTINVGEQKLPAFKLRAK